MYPKYTAREAHLDLRHNGEAPWFAAYCIDCKLMDKAFDWLQSQGYTVSSYDEAILVHKINNLFPGGFGAFFLMVEMMPSVLEAPSNLEVIPDATVISA